MNSGPGCTPCIKSAPTKRAMTMLDGNPSERSGIKAPAVAELLADSGPATPSIAPLPNFSGWRERRFSIAYDANEDIAPLGPGRMPMKKRTMEPLTMGEKL